MAGGSGGGEVGGIMRVIFLARSRVPPCPSPVASPMSILWLAALGAPVRSFRPSRAGGVRLTRRPGLEAADRRDWDALRLSLGVPERQAATWRYEKSTLMEIRVRRTQRNLLGRKALLTWGSELRPARTKTIAAWSSAGSSRFALDGPRPLHAGGVTGEQSPASGQAGRRGPLGPRARRRPAGRAGIDPARGGSLKDDSPLDASGISVRTPQAPPGWRRHRGPGPIEKRGAGSTAPGHLGRRAAPDRLWGVTQGPARTAPRRRRTLPMPVRGSWSAPGRPGMGSAPLDDLRDRAWPSAPPRSPRNPPPERANAPQGRRSRGRGSSPPSHGNSVEDRKRVLPRHPCRFRRPHGRPPAPGQHWRSRWRSGRWSGAGAPVDRGEQAEALDHSAADGGSRRRARPAARASIASCGRYRIRWGWRSRVQGPGPSGGRGSLQTTTVAAIAPAGPAPDRARTSAGVAQGPGMAPAANAGMLACFPEIPKAESVDRHHPARRVDRPRAARSGPPDAPTRRSSSVRRPGAAPAEANAAVPATEAGTRRPGSGVGALGQRARDARARGRGSDPMIGSGMCQNRPRRRTGSSSRFQQDLVEGGRGEP